MPVIIAKMAPIMPVITVTIPAKPAPIIGSTVVIKNTIAITMIMAIMIAMMIAMTMMITMIIIITAIIAIIIELITNGIAARIIATIIPRIVPIIAPINDPIPPSTRSNTGRIRSIFGIPRTIKIPIPIINAIITIIAVINKIMAAIIAATKRTIPIMIFNKLTIGIKATNAISIKPIQQIKKIKAAMITPIKIIISVIIMIAKSKILTGIIGRITTSRANPTTIAMIRTIIVTMITITIKIIARMNRKGATTVLSRGIKVKIPRITAIIIHTTTIIVTIIITMIAIINPIIAAPKANM